MIHLKRGARRMACALAILLVVACTGRVAVARELWVDHDSRGGACSDIRPASTVTQTTPWCTLGAAANQVAPGDTVHVRGGTYTEVHTCPDCWSLAVLQPTTPGTADAWIRFVAEPNETVTLVGGNNGVVHGLLIVAGTLVPAFNEISGFEIRDMPDYCVSVNEVPDIRLRNLDVTACGMGVIHLHHTQRVTLESSRIHDNATHGWTSPVNLYLCQSGNVIRGNWIWSNSDSTPGYPDTEGHGIIMDYCEAAGGALIENNVVWNNEGWCILAYHSDGATIRNNTCYQNGVRADGGEINVLGNGAIVHNNILVPRPGRLALDMRYNESQYTVDPATLQEDFSLLGGQPPDIVVAWGGSTGTLAQYQASNPRGWGAASRQADPLFSNAAASDFHLTALSPARGMGDPQDAPALDIEQNVRPVGAVDNGAYQYTPAVPAAPVANFSVSTTGRRPPLTVAFTDASTGSITGWAWHFGDGTSSTLQSPTHTYTTAGTYAVQLTVTGPGGSTTATGTITVTAPPPVANFSATPSSGQPPLQVVFSDASTGSIIGWVWHFGDGASSTLQSPTHTYATAGTYTVQLTVTGPGGSNTVAKTGAITVTEPPPVANFSATPTSGQVPVTVTFSDASTGNITTRLWHFGDGTSSTLQSPIHTYATAGTYAVQLTVTGPGGSTTAMGSITATAPPPVANFSASPTGGQAPLQVTFSDASTGSVAGWNWHFGDGTSSTLQSPTHTYTTAGTYTVQLTVTGPHRGTTATKTGSITVTAPVSSVSTK